MCGRELSRRFQGAGSAAASQEQRRWMGLEVGQSFAARLFAVHIGSADLEVDRSVRGRTNVAYS